MYEKRELVRRTMQIVKEIFQQNMQAVSYCKGNMVWRFNHMSGYGLYCSTVRKALQGCVGEDRQIRHHQYQVQAITEQVYLVSGLFCIVPRQEGEGIEDIQGIQGIPYEILVCMSGGMAECVHVYGVKPARFLHRVRGLREEIYFLEESEVLYIESSHNNVIWHCRGYQVESRDSLKRLEQYLPEEFVRIHRGYIVNTGQIHSIRSNEVHMSNGDILTIPMRNIATVRKNLLSLERMHSSQKLEREVTD